MFFLECGNFNQETSSTKSRIFCIIPLLSNLSRGRVDMELFTRISHSGKTMLLASGRPKCHMFSAEMLALIKQTLSEPLLGEDFQPNYTMLSWKSEVNGQPILCMLSVGRYESSIHITTFGREVVDLEQFVRERFEKWNLEPIPDEPPPEIVLAMNFRVLSVALTLP